MNIYLLRHAIAFPRGTPGVADKDRSLTEEGRKKMQQEARGIARIVKKFDVILTSPYIRAYETAIITAEEMGLRNCVKTLSALEPGVSFKVLVSALVSYNEHDDLLLVGHEPDMGHISSMFIGLQEAAIEFRKGSLCCIKLDRFPPKQPGLLQWLIKPSQLRALAE